MGSQMGDQLHVFFLPYMAHGHTIPILDMAKLFASRGVKATIISTPINAALFSNTIQRSKNLGIHIDIKIIKFPALEAGLPEGCENLDFVITSYIKGKDLTNNFVEAVGMLQEPLEKLLEETRPDCLVADEFFPWATDAASKFGIPRLVFHGTSFFSMSIGECIEVYRPQDKVSSDSEPFVIPNIPGEVKLTRKQLPKHAKPEQETGGFKFNKVLKEAKESELKSFGEIFNSFYELEPAYVDFYRNLLGRRAWHVGPVSLCNKGIEDKAVRGKEAAITENECLKWLDSKEPNSVIYICFGSMSDFTPNQLKEIATALESSRHDFIWVVRMKLEKEKQEDWDWLDKGFDEKTKGKGLIIRGWAPQVLILDHEAVGGFVTHCGWNSTLEGLTAGKPLVTWPMFHEQFLNEKLVTDVLKVGVAVGVKQWVLVYGDFVSSEAIEKAIKKIMVGEEAEEIRSRAKKLGEMARKAVEFGGSSYSDFNALIGQLQKSKERCN